MTTSLAALLIVVQAHANPWPGWLAALLAACLTVLVYYLQGRYVKIKLRGETQPSRPWGKGRFRHLMV